MQDGGQDKHYQGLADVKNNLHHVRKPANFYVGYDLYGIKEFKIAQTSSKSCTWIPNHY